MAWLAALRAATAGLLAAAPWAASSSSVLTAVATASRRVQIRGCEFVGSTRTREARAPSGPREFVMWRAVGERESQSGAERAREATHEKRSGNERRQDASTRRAG